MKAFKLQAKTQEGLQRPWKWGDLNNSHNCVCHVSSVMHNVNTASFPGATC